LLRVKQDGATCGCEGKIMMKALEGQGHTRCVVVVVACVVLCVTEQRRLPRGLPARRTHGVNARPCVL